MMGERDKLLDTLFDTLGVEHRSIHFCRGPRMGVTPEEFCREVNSAMAQAKALIGQRKGTDSAGQR